MSIVFGSPEANAIAEKDRKLEREHERNEAMRVEIEAGPLRKLTKDERTRFEEVAAEILLEDYADQALEDAKELSDRDLLQMMAGNSLHDEAEIILETRFP